MVEEAIKIEDSKFPTKLASGVLKEGVDTMLKRARGESMEEIVSKLEGEDKVIGERLFEECKKLEGYEDDPSFKFVETLKNSTSHKKKEKGKRVVYKCKGTLPFPLIDIVAFITNNNETKAYFDKMFVNEEYIRNIHPDIKIVHQSYKAKWPTKPRDFVMANWVHLTPLGQVKLIAASCEDPASPPDKEYIRGHIICAGWIFRPISENETEALYSSQLEAAGSVPDFVKDKVAKSQGQIIERIIGAIPKYLEDKAK